MVGWLINPKKKALQESVNLGLTWIKAFGIYEKMVPENEGGILTPHNINSISNVYSQEFLIHTENICNNNRQTNNT